MLSTLTASSKYFEDFTPGDVYRHARGKTVTEMDNVMITNMVMNTAEGHFNEHLMKGNEIFGQRVVFGGINISMVVGLAAQDTAANALAELGMDRIRLRHPVVHGDTLYAYSEVLSAVDAEREDAGVRQPCGGSHHSTSQPSGDESRGDAQRDERSRQDRGHAPAGHGSPATWQLWVKIPGQNVKNCLVHLMNPRLLKFIFMGETKTAE